MVRAEGGDGEDVAEEGVSVVRQAVGVVRQEGVADRATPPVVPQGGEVDLRRGEAQEEGVELGVELGQPASDHGPDVVHVDPVPSKDHRLDGGVWDDDGGVALLVVDGRGEDSLCLEEGVEGRHLAVRGEGRQLAGVPATRGREARSAIDGIERRRVEEEQKEEQK